MKSLLAIVPLLASLIAACAAPPGRCPTGGLDNARNCRRKCVQSLGGRQQPLPCECLDSCACWRFAGHPPRLSRTSARAPSSASGGARG